MFFSLNTDIYFPCMFGIIKSTKKFYLVVKMLFSIGYRVKKDDNLVNEIIKRKSDISEVYLSWGDSPSGRNAQTEVDGLSFWEAQTKQINDIKKLSQNGIKLNLLFNANCYGAKSQSKELFNLVGNTVNYLLDLNLNSVTTTSILIAKFIKQNFKNIDVRASVNMKIGTVNGMEYVADYFDSYYIEREKNRHIDQLQILRKWCNENGKEMYLLANSGCLNNCSAHTFHDNLVAHEKEISAMNNGYSFKSICSEFFKKESNMKRFLETTNFIRPEDVHIYKNLVPAMKLATRVHQNPLRVLKAYIDKKSFTGNLPSLLEPDHSGVLYPYILENKNIKVDYLDKELKYIDGGNAFVKLEECYVDKQND